MRMKMDGKPKSLTATFRRTNLFAKGFQWVRSRMAVMVECLLFVVEGR